MAGRQRCGRVAFSEEQIIQILKAAEAGQKVADLCRKHGISEHTFYRWRSKYGGMDVSDAKKLRALEDENRRLKHLVEPTLGSIHESSIGASSRKLVQGSWLRVERGALVVSSGPSLVPYAASGSARDAFVDALEGATRDLGLRDLTGAVRNAVEPFEREWLGVRNPPATGDDAARGPLILAKGRLEINPGHPYYRPHETHRKGAVYMLGLVAVPKRASPRPDGIPTVLELDDPRSRAVTAVIHLDVGYGSRAAVALAHDLFPELASRLREEVAEPTTVARGRVRQNCRSSLLR